METFRADLHCHTFFSDGTDSPEDLIQKAIDCGLQGLSIADHDTIAAYSSAIPYARSRQFPLLTGVEFSAHFKGEAVHILGYAFSIKSESIRDLCIRHQVRRNERNAKILHRLKELGIEISPEELAQIASGTPGRPHIALLLMKKKVVDSVQAAFHSYLGEGKKAYVPGEVISVEETISCIHKAKGKAVIAHPHLIKKTAVARKLLEFPFDGIECYYAKMHPKEEKKWIDIAKERSLLITGGSDYHGSVKPFNSLGSSWVNKETFMKLYEHSLRHA